MSTKKSALDILSPLLEDPEIMEIMIDGPERVSVEKSGSIEDTDIHFGSNDELKDVIEAALEMAGQKLEEGKTVYEVRFSDNSRMVAVLSPTAVNGHSVIFRKWMTKQLTWEKLIGFGSVTTEYRDLMQSAINANISILVAGGTNSGKTTITNNVIELIPLDKRVIVVEETHFYQFTHPRVTFLEAKSSPDMTMNELLTTGSRMRPDWLVVGELEGAEAMHTMQLFSTGHTGITTMHATSAENALVRLESMCLMANLGLGMEDIRQVIASALRLIAYQERLPNGRRKVTQVVELLGMENDRYILQPLMRYNAEKDALEKTGVKPSWE
ncbi:MAG TPA: ATPase, T2SS/T4P/T4SS family [Anaerolineales bacterium]|nr:ATPase, T2SS/T4P/T4SS family [Anaerolineales bacterium]